MHLISYETFISPLQIKELKINLAIVLLQELSNCQCRSLHAALRSSRRPLKLLATMGKAREACVSLLRVCSSAIRSAQRQARRNNLAISELFFCDLAQVAIEFLRAFNNQAACISSKIRNEIFLKLIKKQTIFFRFSCLVQQ